MDGVGGEVSDKIRAAIKAKLIELEAYVDDELPDYIMVMVANKRSRSQMEDDLSLFLNNNTKVFTTWLHSVLKKLQEVTIAAADKKDHEGNIEKRKRSTSKEVEKPKLSGSKDAEKCKRSTSKDPLVKMPKAKDIKTKKKHGKKHKEKKAKKDKHKNKEKPEVERGSIKFKSNGKRTEIPTDSDWSDSVPKKKLKAVNEVNLKEKQKEIDKGEASKAQEILTVPEHSKNVDIPAKAPDIEGTDWETPDGVVVGTRDGTDSILPMLAASSGQAEKQLKGQDCMENELTNTSSTAARETTVLVPTMELLREHDKLTSQQVVLPDPVLDPRPASHIDSEESLDPEIIRQHLLMSREKKRRAEERALSNVSSEIVILEEKTTEKPASHPEDKLNEEVPSPAVVDGQKTKSPKLRQPSTSSSSGRLSFSAHSPHSSSPTITKNSTKRTLSSHIVAPPEPLEPEIASVVQVKPREFVPKEKQANKKLILKAVAAAERSVAVAPTRKAADDKPKALFTKDLREKRYENMAVTVPNTKSRRDEKRGSEGDGEERQNVLLRRSLLEGEEEHFISSKASAKDRNVLFIHTWLEGVKEAGQNDALIKPDEIEVRASEEEEEAEGEENKLEERINATQDGAQIVVVVDGVTSKRRTTVRTSTETAPSKVSKEVNRISDRFAKISQPAEQHEFKEKFREFERARTERKLTQDGESKNKQLIAKLSMKFGQVDREFNDVEREPERKRKSGREDERGSRKERKTSRLSGELSEELPRGNSSERCRLWPDCSRGASCEFYHPSSICKLLPNCKFKEKCLYIHPVCRKDADCRVRDCPYEHRRRRKSDSRDPPKKVLCKYDRSCKKSGCPYLHSKRPCRYGSRCSNRGCTFSHRRASPTR